MLLFELLCHAGIVCEVARRQASLMAIFMSSFASVTSDSVWEEELLVSACAGTPGEWSLLVTGHSLGGAVATLVATELAGGVDTSRGFKQQQDMSQIMWERPGTCPSSCCS